MKTAILFITTFLSANFATAQVLFTENFDNLTLGALSTDPTGATSGQNGWYVEETTGGTEIVVVAEPGRGNVLNVKPTNPAGNNFGARFRQKDIDALWNSRNAGNDILVLQFEYYFAVGTTSFASFMGFLRNNAVFTMINQSNGQLNFSYQKTSAGAGGLGTVTSVNNTNAWISVEIFVDYSTGNMYLYIPVLSILESYAFSHNDIPDTLEFRYGHMIPPNNPNVGGKFDNIRISALQTLPAYLGIDDFISSKFNVFPNPVIDMVTISNAENIGIDEITVYDVNGRIIKSQEGKTANEIQLNIEDLATGTYLLHIQTNAGTAVKKFIKK